MSADQPAPAAFVSEPVTPRAGSFLAAAMGRGEPGLPTGFRWRDVWFDIREVRESWKETGREGGRATGEVYLRRHCHRLLMSDGAEWVVYFTRQPARGGPPKQRWYLRTCLPARAGD